MSIREQYPSLISISYVMSVKSYEDRIDISHGGNLLRFFGTFLEVDYQSLQIFSYRI